MSRILIVTMLKHGCQQAHFLRTLHFGNLESIATDRVVVTEDNHIGTTRYGFSV